jgi:uncharacterized protein (DUF2062 family)
MNRRARVYALIATVLAVIFKTHLTIAAAGLVISVSLPLAFIVVSAAATAVVLWLVLRSNRGFRSSPYPRPVS